MEDIHNFKRQFERILVIIQKSEDISKENKETIFKFKDFLLSDSIGMARITSYLHYSRKYAQLLQKPFQKAKEVDIRAVIAKLNQTSLSENSKKGFKITLKRLYRFIEKTKKGVYPEKVSWLSTTIHNSKKKLPEEMLNEEEILQIIKKCKTLRDKALISTLAESGCRISEIALMRIKHVSFEEYGARLVVHGKTGMRKILVVNSTPYLQEWINQHPENNNPENYLWYNSDGEPLCYTRIAAILKQAVKETGIKKRVYPHLFRHSRATFLAPIMSDASMKHYFGWTQGSCMNNVYVHLSGMETDAAILEASGVKIEKEIKKSKMEPKKCIRCKTINEPTNRFCKLCGLVLDSEEANKLIDEDSKRKQADDVMEKLIDDPEFRNFLKRKLCPQ